MKDVISLSLRKSNGLLRWLLLTFRLEYKQALQDFHSPEASVPFAVMYSGKVKFLKVLDPLLGLPESAWMAQVLNIQCHVTVDHPPALGPVAVEKSSG